MQPHLYLQQIELALSEVLEQRVSGLTEQSHLETDLDLDSVTFMQFLLTLEDRIPGLLFNPDQLAQEDFNQVGSLLKYIADQQAHTGA
jgi:acyl carrier protein